MVPILKMFEFLVKWKKIYRLFKHVFFEHYTNKMWFFKASTHT